MQGTPPNGKDPHLSRPHAHLPFLALAPAAVGPCSDSDPDPGPPGPLDRLAEGVVLTGAELPGLLGTPPPSIAAFRWAAAEGWLQVPVQIDERAVVSWLQIYGGFQPPWPEPLEPTDTVLTWCDAGTFTGPDPDPSFDADDELALAASDSGERAPAETPLPGGALADGATELLLVDPLDGAPGWLYLVRHDGSLDPTAGEQRVQYTFELASGESYLDGYVVVNSTNPESSTAESPGVWRMSFTDRWIQDVLILDDGVPAPVDLLDRHRISRLPPGCERHEDSFSGYTHEPSEGVFLANVEGPVRAIRSVAGSNSGVLTQSDHVFWPRRVDVTTTVRVHPYPGVEDVLDLAPEALGMRYVAPWVAGGIVLDGDPTNDPVPPDKAPTWEVLTGESGTLIVSHRIAIDQPGVQPEWRFADDLAPPLLPCTGDAHAIGAFGVWLPESGNTDPRLVDVFGELWHVQLERALYVEPAELPAGLAPKSAKKLAVLRHAQHHEPIEVTPAPFGPQALGAPKLPAEPLQVAAAPSGSVVQTLELPGAPSLRWSLAAGALPSGITLDEAGVLRGRTLAAGARHVVLRAENGAGAVHVRLDLELPRPVLGRSLASWIRGAIRGGRALIGMLGRQG